MFVAPLALALATLPAEPRKVARPAGKAAKVAVLKRGPVAIKPLPPVMLPPPPPGGGFGGGMIGVGGPPVSSTLSPSGTGGDESVLKAAKVPTTPRGLLN